VTSANVANKTFIGVLITLTLFYIAF